MSGLPPRRDIDFSIELVPGVVPMSRTPYRMSTLELVDLKLQLKDMWDKPLSSYEGNEKVKDAKLQTHGLEFEKLKCWITERGG